MNIAQVVAHMSEDGAYGGPTTVAMNQAIQLAALGHTVTLYSTAQAAQSRTWVDSRVTFRTFRARRLPRLGFAGLFAPDMLTAVLRGGHDVVHIHMARDLVTLPVAVALHLGRMPFVIQTHGMIDTSSRKSARLLDALATKRAVTAASAVLSLTTREDYDIRQLAPGARVVRVPNGVPLSSPVASESRGLEVVFLARLHPRKRPEVFVEMAELLIDSLPEAHFSIYGPDEGRGHQLAEIIRQKRLESRVRLAGAVEPKQVSHVLSAARVYVLPSVDEVFPMTVLEAFQAGTPVVATSSLGIAADCIEYDAAVITGESARSLADGVVQAWSPERAASLRRGASRYLSEKLDIANVARLLEAEYLRAANSTASRNMVWESK